MCVSLSQGVSGKEFDWEDFSPADNVAIKDKVKQTKINLSATNQIDNTLKRPPQKEIETQEESSHEVLCEGLQNEEVSELQAFDQGEGVGGLRHGEHKEWEARMVNKHIQKLGLTKTRVRLLSHPRSTGQTLLFSTVRTHVRTQTSKHTRTQPRE